MREHYLKRWVFPFTQLLLQNGFFEKYKFLKKTKRWKRSQIQNYQLKQLKAIVRHSYETVPAYGQLMREQKLTPKDIIALKDIRKLPILTKALIRSKGAKNFLSLKAQRISASRTAGSTGEPFEFFLDSEIKGWKQARYFFTLENSGYVLGKPYVRLWGQSTSSSLQDLYLKHVVGRHELNAFNINEQDHIATLEKLERFSPALLESYASMVVYLAQHALESNRTFSIPIVITSAEALQSYQRKLITKAFGSRIVNRYGSREFGNIAQECEHGSMHIIETNFFVESIQGRLLVTCFDNYSMPLIRYDMGDLGTVSKSTCACKNHGNVLKNLAGRTAEAYVSPSGIAVPPTYFYYAIDYKYGKHMKKFQVRIKKDSSLEVRIVPKHTFRAEISEHIRKDLTKTLGPLDVTISTVKAIKDSQANKKQAIIRE